MLQNEIGFTLNYLINMTPFNKLAGSPITGPSILSFNTDNAKLRGTQTAAFSLPAGYTCPGAKDCLAWFDRDVKKLKDGKDAKYRCFAATMEAAFPSVAKSVHRNLSILKQASTVEGMAEVIHMSLPSAYYKNIRVHADGDFFSANYFVAWMEVARRNPERVFYAYTKNLPVWVRYMKLVPSNFVLTASQGGKWDELIAKHNLRHAVVVFHPEDAEALSLQIDDDDRLARDPSVAAFALLLHGVQAAGSEASLALKRLKAEGVEFSYSKKSKP